MGEGICLRSLLGERGGCGTRRGESCWVRGAQGPCKVCSLHGVLSDGMLLAGVEPGYCVCGLAVGG